MSKSLADMLDLIYGKLPQRPVVPGGVAADTDTIPGLNVPNVAPMPAQPDPIDDVLDSIYGKHPAAAAAPTPPPPMTPAPSPAPADAPPETTIQHLVGSLQQLGQRITEAAQNLMAPPPPPVVDQHALELAAQFRDQTGVGARPPAMPSPAAPSFPSPATQHARPDATVVSPAPPSDSTVGDQAMHIAGETAKTIGAALPSAFLARTAIALGATAPEAVLPALAIALAPAAPFIASDVAQGVPIMEAVRNNLGMVAGGELLGKAMGLLGKETTEAFPQADPHASRGAPPVDRAKIRAITDMRVAHAPEPTPEPAAPPGPVAKEAPAPERIVAATVRNSKGQEFDGPIHAAARDVAYRQGALEDKMSDGFRTSEGRFVDRFEARKIAESAGQAAPNDNRLVAEDVQRVEPSFGLTPEQDQARKLTEATAHTQKIVLRQRANGSTVTDLTTGEPAPVENAPIVTATYAGVGDSKFLPRQVIEDFTREHADKLLDGEHVLTTNEPRPGEYELGVAPKNAQVTQQQQLRHPEDTAPLRAAIRVGDHIVTGDTHAGAVTNAVDRGYLTERQAETWGAREFGEDQSGVPVTLKNEGYVDQAGNWLTRRQANDQYGAGEAMRLQDAGHISYKSELPNERVPLADMPPQRRVVVEQQMAEGRAMRAAAGLPPLEGPAVETIRSAAVRTPSGVYEAPAGGLHLDARELATSSGDATDHAAMERGYVTSGGRFVTDAEAKRIATQADQLEPRVPGGFKSQAPADKLLAEEFRGGAPGKRPLIPFDKAPQELRDEYLGSLEGNRNPVPQATDVVSRSHTDVPATEQPQVELRRGRPAVAPDIAPAPERLPEERPAAPEDLLRDKRAGFFDLSGVGTAVKGAAKRYFTAAGDLPQQVFDRKLQRDFAIGHEVTELRFTVRDFRSAIKKVYGGGQADSEVFRRGETEVRLPRGSTGASTVERAGFVRAATETPKMSPAEITKIDDVLKGARPVTDLHPDLQWPVTRMRDHIDVLSQRMMDEGVVEGELVPKLAQNMGTYMTRSYRVFDDPEWAHKIDPAVRNRAKSWVDLEYPSLTPEERAGKLNEYLYAGQDGPMALISGKSRIGAKDLSILTKRGDIPEEIRALWGEYGGAKADPLVNYTRSITKMASLIENHKFLEDVANEGRGTFLFDKPIVKDGVSYHTRLVPEGSKVMSPMGRIFGGDVYTSPEIAKAFQDAAGDGVQHGAIFRAYMKVNSAVKFSKTVGSLMTQVRNLLGNVGFAIANGHYRVSALGDSMRALGVGLGVSDNGAWQDAYKRLVRLGVVDQSAVEGELRDAIKEAGWRDMDSMTDSLASRAAKRTVGALTTAYRAEDDVWKVYAFGNETARYQKAYPSWAPEQVEQKAAEIVRATYPNYSMVPEAIKMARRSPLIGSFVSFPWEVGRTAYNTLNLAVKELADPATRTIGTERMSGLLVAATGTGAAAAGSRAILGIDKKTDDNVRLFLPSWSQNSDLVYVSRKDGQVEYIDMSYSDPHNYLKNPLRAFMRGEDWQKSILSSVAELTQPFIGEEILAQKLIDIKRNQTPEGARVYNPEAQFEDQLGDAMNHVWAALEPGTVTSMRRVYRGLENDQTIYGRNYDPKIEAIAAVTGVRREKLDLPTAVGFKANEFMDKTRDADRLLSQAASTRGSVSDDKLREAYDESEHSRRELFDTMHKQAQAAIKLGVPETAVVNILDSRGMTRRLAHDIVDGVYRVQTPGATFLKGISDASAAVADSPEARRAIRQEFDRRRRVVYGFAQKARQER